MGDKNQLEQRFELERVLNLRFTGWLVNRTDGGGAVGGGGVSLN